MTPASSPARPAPAFRYEALPAFTQFAQVLDPAVYAPVPDDWWIGLTDIVDSTGAIARGRYRAVNFAGAAAIGAVRNALDGRDFAFAFGGDGASMAVAPGDRAAVARALAATATWAGEELDLVMRAAMVPVRDARAAGLDLRVARYAASDAVVYAMFEGGGLAFADARAKAGAYTLPPAPAGTRPDLTGLACRFDVSAVEDGLVLSLIALPESGADPNAARAALAAVLARVEASPAAGRPLPAAGPLWHWPPADLDLEVRAHGPLLGSRALRRALVSARVRAGYVVWRLGLGIGRLSPRAYGRELAANADFRKFGDGLRLTVACDAATADAIEAGLEEARAAGLLRYGLHRQAEAVVTCITTTPLRRDHVHFVDGADGGYARAAARLKAPPVPSPAPP